MMIEFEKRTACDGWSGVRVIWIVMGLVLVAAFVASNSGCYQRTIAPEISYDQDQVDRINAEIKKLDWEE